MILPIAKTQRNFLNRQYDIVDNSPFVLNFQDASSDSVNADNLDKKRILKVGGGMARLGPISFFPIIFLVFQNQFLTKKLLHLITRRRNS